MHKYVFVFSCMCFVWLLARLFLSTLSPLLKASPAHSKPPPPFVSSLLGCLETASSVRDAEEGRSLRRGAEHKRTSPTLTSSVSNTTDQGRRWAIPYPADCESFGNVPCLCEYHHLISAGGLIRNSLMGWAVAPILWDNQS